MSFLGQPSRKRPINLGNKQQLSRQDLLRRAQEDRALRQENRRHLEAASTLQRSFRRFVAELKYKRRILRLLEASPHLTGDTFMAEFIACAGVLDSAKDPQGLIARVQVASSNEWLHRRLLISLNRLWLLDSPLLEAVQPLYANPSADIIKPLHAYATTTRKHSGFLKAIFEELALLYPQQLLNCALENDTLMNLDVTLRMADIEIPSSASQSQITYLLQQSISNMPDSALLVARLVGALDKITDPSLLQSLTQTSNLRAVNSLGLDERSYAQFLLPLVHSSARTELLARLILAGSNIRRFWRVFQQSALFPQVLKLVDNYALDLPSRDNDWSLLVVMLEMYSYHLVVCNDSTLFDPLGLEDVEQLATVLRGICFIKSWSNWSVDIGSKAASNEIFFTVTRQLHSRNTRRPFLPANFWLVSRHMPMVRPGELEAMLSQLTHHLHEFDDEDDEEEDASAVRVRLSPMAEILKETPFFIDFLTRVSLFNQFISQDKADRRHPENFSLAGVRLYQVNRESVARDVHEAFDVLAARGEGGMKSRFRVQILSGGEPEVGIDGGGLTKEALTSLCQQVFVERSEPEYSGLFVESGDHTLYPNAKYGITAHQTPEIAAKYRFLGQVIGKCLYENLLVDVEFSPLFLQKWAGGNNMSSFDDFYLLDPELYANLIKLLTFGGNVEDLALDFTSEDAEGRSVELRAGGENISVTNSNRLEYLHALAHYKLNSQLGWQTRHFLRGISSFISPYWLKMFNAREIQMLISGQSTDISVDDLRVHSVANGFAQDVYLDNFWQVVREMSPAERRALIKFVTSVPRGPLEGFARLNPRFGVRSAGRDDERLPTASTCVNLLKLPEYSSKELLREKLLYSINSNAGFDLS